MTKKELIDALKPYDEDAVVVCMDEFGGWDNIQHVKKDLSGIVIVFGGGNPFSDE